MLVIGYGNELRRDDGLGPRSARAIDALQLPDVRVLVVHQLTPELAELISHHAQVVFLDAAVDCEDDVMVRRLNLTDRPHHPGPALRVEPHRSDPTQLLALAERLFGRYPSALWVTLRAHDLGFGTDLSCRGAAVYERGLRLVRELCESPAAHFRPSNAALAK